ncbi:hypothetical protein G6F70_004666 [Rhizopus microsporus]|nr:hypothetical protein G6F71_004725 [Rhizopus microsporus]KAG1199733.1 hypothetical protein G6F70_004666 [Rhizopus microsporus]KAG1211467.1 hypothetical protein G6F69_004575 [Rhizopus microsporus]KAG1233392.1 hypothetical protein G6F67_004313 [Rhizopus microsporus]KAG1265399.1 hypothetical protein G6F68_003614 [Rhizopus microsporus]
MSSNGSKPNADDTSGLHSSITEDQIKERFSKFGTISNVQVAKDCENLCRGFAHMNIETTTKKWAQCLSVFKGSKWKGQEIKIEEAKMDYKEREALRQQKIEERQERKRKRLARWNDSDGFHAKDMSLITDNNINNKRGWKRGRYGRAIAVMRLSKPDGTKFVFDPTHYKNNLTKLYNIGVPMKPVEKLISTIDDDEYTDDDTDDKYGTIDHMESLDDEDKATENIKSLDDEKRRAAIEKRAEEQRAKKELISKSLAGEIDDSNHITFETEEDSLQQASENDENQQKKTEADDRKWLFDSSEDEDDDEEINIQINPVLEGEEGRKRLELQSRFKGDERFKLGEDFIDEEEAETKADIGDSISQELSTEKNQAMDVLRFMFGEDKIVTKAPAASNIWTNAARFDPDAEDSYKYLTTNKTEDTSKDNESDHDTEMEKAKEDEQSDDDFFDKPNQPQSIAPEVSTEKHFEVNTNLKPLFGGSEGTFKLFGDDNEEDKVEEEQAFVENTPTVDYSLNFASTTKASNTMGLGIMFFFHFDDPELLKKSCFSYDPEGIFQYRPEEQEDYEAKWREKRRTIKDILKKRQKQAIRMEKKRMTKALK